MDVTNGTSWRKLFIIFKFLFIFLICLILIFICCIYKNYLIYKNINIVSSDDVSISYGTDNVILNNIVSKYDGSSIKIVQDIDTSVVGKQEMVVEVYKNGLTKDFPIIINVVDVESPIINLKSDSVTINKGDSIDVLSNINNINDGIDGELNYISSDSIDEKSNNYYTYYVDSNLNEVGTHIITLKAVDKSGNVSEKSFNYIVKDNSSVVNKKVNANLPANGSSNNIVNLAYSLIGSPYVSGGNSPSGFDCSGFVQYVYAQNGYTISRSSSTQANDGYLVSYDDIQPGDILNMGSGSVTHFALYVGDGLMIHAANPSQGVILSNVSGWVNGSSDKILSVRRIL